MEKEKPKHKGSISDHFWETCILTVARKFQADITLRREDYDTVAYLYEGVGGAWEGLASGDVYSWDLLRKACKAYLKRKLSESNEE